MLATVKELNGMSGPYYAIEVSDGNLQFILRMAESKYSELCHRLTGQVENHANPAMFGYMLDMAMALNAVPALDLNKIGK